MVIVPDIKEVNALDARLTVIYFRTAVFLVLAFILIQTLTLRSFAAEPIESTPPTASESEVSSVPQESTSSVPESGTGETPPEETLPEETPPEETPPEETPPDNLPEEPPAVSEPSTVHTTDLLFNPPDLTPEKAIYQIRFCVVFFVYGVIPLYTAVFLIWAFFKWVYGLLVRAV